MVKICQMQLLKLNFEIIPKKHIFRYLPKISAGHAWSWKFFFANLQILGPLGCQGRVVIPQNVKKSKSLHPNVQRSLVFFGVLKCFHDCTVTVGPWLRKLESEMNEFRGFLHRLAFPVFSTRFLTDFFPYYTKILRRTFIVS